MTALSTASEEIQKELNLLKILLIATLVVAVLTLLLVFWRTYDLASFCAAAAVEATQESANAAAAARGEL